MPHIPRQFRPPPTSMAPSSSEALGVGLPSDSPPRTKPSVEKRGGGRGKRIPKIRAKESLSMVDWDVNPFQIMKDMEGEQSHA